MTTKEINRNHFGILGSVDWNSNKWTNLPTEEDLKSVNFEYLRKTNETYTFLNFAIDKEIDSDNIHSGLVPHLHSHQPQPEFRNAIKAVIIKSLNPYDGQNYIVGYYLFPEIKNIEVESPFPDFCEIMELCITSKMKHIHQLENYINLKDCNSKLLLPNNKQMGKMGFNYLEVNNVEYIFKMAISKNPDDQKLLNNYNSIMLDAGRRQLLKV